jgi:hypothetical protein
MLELGGVGIEFVPGLRPLIWIVFKVSLAGGGCRKVRSSRLHDASKIAAINNGAIWRALHINSRSTFLLSRSAEFAELCIH